MSVKDGTERTRRLRRRIAAVRGDIGQLRGVVVAVIPAGMDMEFAGRHPRRCDRHQQYESGQLPDGALDPGFRTASEEAKQHGASIPQRWSALKPTGTQKRAEWTRGNDAFERYRRMRSCEDRNEQVSPQQRHANKSSDPGRFTVHARWPRIAIVRQDGEHDEGRTDHRGAHERRGDIVQVQSRGVFAQRMQMIHPESISAKDEKEDRECKVRSSLPCQLMGCRSVH
jgi:hypothetical protein